MIMREFSWLRLSSDLLLAGDTGGCCTRKSKSRSSVFSSTRKPRRRLRKPGTRGEVLAENVKETEQGMAMAVILPMRRVLENESNRGRRRLIQSQKLTRQHSAEDCVCQMPPRSAAASITDRRLMISAIRNRATETRSRPIPRCTVSSPQIPTRSTPGTDIIPISPEPIPVNLADRHLVNPPLTPPSSTSTSPRKSPTRRALPMALKFLTSSVPTSSNAFSSSSSTSGVKYFDIRLDNDYIVFRGNEDEAPAVPLSGSVVLCLSEPLSVTHVTLTLSGIVHMSWQTSSTSSMSGKRSASREKTFFEKQWTFKTTLKNKAETLSPENYEWPFEHILDGNLPESVEGMKDGWIIYRFKAEIGRKRGKDIVVRKPLRLVRTLDSSALELAHEMSVENIWPNKVQYSISIPSKAIAFGSFLRLDFKLVSLLKGLTVGNVSTQLREEQEFIVDPEWGVHALGNGHMKSERLIASDSYTVDAENDEQIIDEAAEGYQFTRYIELPKSLKECVQDCNVKGIKVRHKVKFNVQLHNPDGHISELRANLPVTLYISPNLPINENNDLVDQSPQASRAAVENDLAQTAPPLYGQHILDKLYSDVDPTGYLTPGMSQSRSGTPYLRSLNPSSDNLARLSALQASSGPSTPDASSVSPAALHNRLQNLHVGTHSNLVHDVDLPAESPDQANDYFVSRSRSNSSSNLRHSPRGDASDGFATQSGSGTQSESAAMSRRISEEDENDIPGTRTPYAQYLHTEDLAKLPSYTTAVKTAVPRRNRESSGNLPSYGSVMTSSTSPPSLAEPPTAHLRNHVRQASSGMNSSDVPTNTNQNPPSNRSVGAIQDEERRLRMMQQRAL